MCSASSQGSSMWPNITVTVERRPALWRGLDDLDPAGHRQLVRRDPLAHPVVEHLGGGSRRGVQAGLAQPMEDLDRRQTRGEAHVVDLHGRVGVQVQLGRDLLRRPQPLLVVLERPVGMDARLDAELGGAELHGVGDLALEVLARMLVGVGRALALSEPAERAADDADVRDVDVAVHHEGHGLPGQLGAAARRRPGACPRSPRGGSRRTAR